MTIDAGRLEEMFRDSLFEDDEIDGIRDDRNLTVESYMEMPEDQRPFIAVQGVIHNVAFHPQRLESHRDEIRGMLEQLPDSFRVSVGGGMSFLNMCMTRDDQLWGEHPNVEQLATMAIALGLGTWPAPKEMWSILPGGMPYFTYLDKSEVPT